MINPATYSSSRVAHGPLVFISGQIPVTADGQLAGDDIVSQTRQVLAHISAALTEHGTEWAQVVKMNYYLRDLSDLAALREVLITMLPDPRPAATLTEVSGLVDPRFRIEIDAVVTLPPPQGQ